jgi:hypothetical protein
MTTPINRCNITSGQAVTTGDKRPHLGGLHVGIEAKEGEAERENGSDVGGGKGDQRHSGLPWHLPLRGPREESHMEMKKTHHLSVPFLVIRSAVCMLVRVCVCD